MVAAAPDATGAEISAALTATAVPSPYATPDDRGHDLLYGWGRVDPAAALRALLGLPQPTADAGPASADAGPADGGTSPPPPGGCGCRARSTGARPVGIFALLALALLVRRRPR